MNKFDVRAYAKINLGLDVVGKLPNSYHEVRMIMQTVNLYDRLSFSRTASPNITLKTNLHFLPVNENNLVYAAVKLFKETFNIEDGVYITLDKHIPVAAGMAGGSTDAAAALRAMNRLFKTGLSTDQLKELGLKLGADVPYCIQGGTCLAEGIGERLTPLSPAPDAFCLIVKPPINVSTQFVYSHLKLDPDTVHPDIDGIKAAIEGNDLHGMCRLFGNVLESVTVAEYPVISEIKQKMLELGALNSLMSGSGPTVFGIFDDAHAAEKAFYHFKVGPFGRHSFLTDFRNQVQTK